MGHFPALAGESRKGFVFGPVGISKIRCLSGEFLARAHLFRFRKTALGKIDFMTKSL